MNYAFLRLPLTAVAASVWLSGCQVFNLNEASIEAPGGLYASATATVPFKLAGNDQPDWLIPESDDAPEFTLTRKQELVDSDFSGASFLAYMVTLTLVPAYSEHTYADEFQLSWLGEPLLTSRKTYAIDDYFGLYFPTPLLMPGTLFGEEEEKASARPLLDKAHRATVLATIEDQKAEYDRVNPETPLEIASYLEGIGRNSVYRPAAIQRLMAMAPETDTLNYHARNAGVPGYVELLPTRHQAWLIGPQGLRGIDLKTKLTEGASEDELLVQMLRAYPSQEERVAYAEENKEQLMYRGLIDTQADIGSTTAWIPYYQGLNQYHRELLLEGGLPKTLVDRMSNREPSPQLLAAARTGKLRDENGNLNIPSAEELLEQLVRDDNRGRYMSPYTSDGVLAEWVDSAINANIGSTVGSGVGAAAGAYAAEQALDNVPFGGLIGGMIGSQIGESAGRETAISASGGWEAIQETSDRSFDSLENMAKYLREKYGSTQNFTDAMAATAQIYPELQEHL